MVVNIVHEEMRAALSDLRAASARLTDDRRAADREVSALLDGSWTGAAADAFADGWSDWCAGADRVKVGLDAMCDLMEAAHRDLVVNDDASQDALDRIAQRIVERLG
jgi:WXG100 family type VII secretion target